jgi:RNA polymerase sigma-70 factor (ECF subfamily)
VINRSTSAERHARFEALFNESYEALLAYARRRVGADADDVVAESLTVAWRRLDEMPSDSLPWLYGVARKVISDQRRAGRRRDALAQRIRAEAATWPADGAVASQRPTFSALARLSARDREAILLVAWEELTAEQAATAMGCSTVAFRVRLHRARKRLRTYLSELDVGSSGQAQASVIAKEAKST